MSKQTRQQKKEAERRIIADFEAAMEESATKKTMTEELTAETGKTDTPSKEQIKKQKREHGYDDTMPQKVHCKRCKTLMEKGVCPTCGFRIYVPMSKEKRDKVRLIVAGVAMVVFLVVFVCMQFANG